MRVGRGIVRNNSAHEAVGVQFWRDLGGARDSKGFVIRPLARGLLWVGDDQMGLSTFSLPPFPIPAAFLLDTSSYFYAFCISNLAPFTLFKNFTKFFSYFQLNFEYEDF